MVVARGGVVLLLLRAWRAAAVEPLYVHDPVLRQLAATKQSAHYSYRFPVEQERLIARRLVRHLLHIRPNDLDEVHGRQRGRPVLVRRHGATNSSHIYVFIGAACREDCRNDGKTASAKK
jgi:hypothetical protein